MTCDRTWSCKADVHHHACSSLPVPCDWCGEEVIYAWALKPSVSCKHSGSHDPDVPPLGQLDLFRAS